MSTTLKDRKRKAAASTVAVVEADTLEGEIEQRVVKKLKDGAAFKKVAAKLAHARRTAFEDLTVMSPPHPKYREYTKMINSCVPCAVCSWAAMRANGPSRELGMRVGAPTIEELDAMGYAVVYTKGELMGVMHCSCAMIFLEWSKERDTPLADMEDDLIERTRVHLEARTCDVSKFSVIQETINVSDYI